MKSWRKRILAVFTFLLIAAGIFSWVQFRKVHKVAILSTSESFSDLHSDFLFIAKSVWDSTLVVHGTIIDPDSTVHAVPSQDEVAYPQGWAAATVRVHEVLSGTSGSSEILVVPAGWWPTPVVGHSFLKPFVKNEEYLFFLNKDVDLSRWCKTTVFSHSGQDPIPLPKSGSNPKNAVK